MWGDLYMRIFKKNSLLKIWCIIALTLAFILVGAQICGVLCDKLLKHGFLYSYEDKLNILRNKSKNKTVFLGGSSVLFGVNAEHYSEISGSSAVNMGLNAGAGVYDLYLATVSSYLQAGDSVVLAFEYDAYTTNWVEFTNITLDLANVAPTYVKTLSFGEKIDYYFHQNLRYYNKSFDIIYNFLSTKLEPEPSIYVRKNVNDFGDFNLEYTKNSTEKTPLRKPNGFVINEESMFAMKRYISDFESRGIKVYVAYPPAYVDVSEEVLLKFDKQFREIFGRRIIGKITDWSFYTGEKFFDTAYHLNASACIEHTDYYYNLITASENES